jgi:hypothetical protein
MTLPRKFTLVLASLALLYSLRGPAIPAKVAPALKTRNVVLIVIDGLRWQDVFHGPNPALMDQQHGGVENIEQLRRDFSRATPAESRAAVLPFLWNVVARQGQIFGNQDKQSVARVANGMAFSYPGYNEMLVGYPDARIDKNEFGPNPNITAFEWLNRMPEYRGRVAVFASWSVFNDIFNVKRSGLFISAGWDPPQSSKVDSRQALLREIYSTTTRLWDDNVYDAFVQPLLLDYVREHHPRVLFVGYGEADDWAHAGRYDLVLRSAHQCDLFIEQLWKAMQSIPQYRGQTTFIITTDHGRGGGLTEWKEHGAEQKGSENIWIGVLGPDTAALGERASLAAVTQGQIAATLAALLSKDYRSSVPQSAVPLPDAVGLAQSASAPR